MVDHSDDSLIDIQNSTVLEFELLQFLKKSLDEDSQVEFNSSGFGARVSINIFNSNSLRYKLNYLNDSVELINLNNIDQLLLEELHKLSIDLCSNLRIFK